MYGRIRMIVLAAAAIAPLLQSAASPARPASAAGIPRLSRFPYLRWPASVVPRNPPVVQAKGHFRFWDGTSLQDVEGRTYLATLVGRDGRRTFDEPLLRRKVEADLLRMGATRLASGRVPASLIDTINDADKQALLPGLGEIRSDPVETWTIRGRNRQIWFHYTGNPAQASIAVVETRLD
ncbi:hypothetical protein [uncultured Sphingomonas sp.]|uniref:hypothetical protein n=1 Tax=uncultured Sphingomonas sp. TaxID=158754 RepID=UPI0035CB9C0E